MALFDDLNESMRKVILAGVGAVALGAEKSQDLLEDLVKKGEETIEQGKTLNDELTRKVRETAESASDEVLRNKFRGMTAEERAEWLARAAKISEDLEAEDAAAQEEEPEESEVVEPEEVEVETPATDAPVEPEEVEDVSVE